MSWDFSHGSFQPHWYFFSEFSIWQCTVSCQKRCQGMDFVEDWERQKIPSPLEPELLKMFQVPVPCHFLQPASFSVYLWHLALEFLLENLSLHPWSCLWRAWPPCLQGTPCEGCVSEVEEMDKLRKSWSACQAGLSPCLSSDFSCGAEEKTLTVKPKQQKVANTVLEQSSCLRCSRCFLIPFLDYSASLC